MPQTATTDTGDERIATENFVTIPLEGLRVGVRLRSPILFDRDDRQVVAVEAGATITESLLERLRERGATRVRLHEQEFRRMRGGEACALPGAASGGEQVTVSPTGGAQRLPLRADSFVHRVHRHGAAAYDPQAVEAFEEAYQGALLRTREFVTQLSDGALKGMQPATEISLESLERIAQDIDLFVALGIRPDPAEYPYRHSAKTAMLALALGTELGLSQSELVELGIGCLAHDAGMLKLASPLYTEPRSLVASEISQIHQHSVLAYDLVRGMEALPVGAKLVVFQMHERCDGSGYPLGRGKGQIHRLAQLAAVADVYIAMTSDRPYRKAKTPYRALAEILDETGKGRFDSLAARALLQTVTLFPIGSCVQIDGRPARVIRSNGEHYSRPVIEMLGPGQRVDPPEVIDLHAQPHLKIARTLSESEAQAMAEGL